MSSFSRDRDDEKERFPKHVAVIMDGNGRWATQRGMDRTMGHFAASKMIKPIILAADELGIKILSLFCFSTENWRRPQLEVESLFDLLTQYTRLESDELDSWGIRVKFIGDIKKLPERTQLAIQECEALLAHNTHSQLNFFVNYGGRAEIVNAAKELAEDVKNGLLNLDEIDEQSFSRKLFTGNMPDPDLIIRTSGEQRVSNFLLWQLAYSELLVTETLWPDFSPEDLRKACLDYSRRFRRFGDVS
ncbi:isoprenyl transferase [bacterium]|nr:isoprenyl transferase [bacterium]